MPDSESSISLTNRWRNIARSVRQAVLPTVQVDLLGTTYRLRSEARTQKADRDYAFLRDLAVDKHCIFDVGANKGLTALVMAGTMAKDGRIVTFEASEEGCRMIQDHAELNGLGTRIAVVNALVAERSGLVVDFYGDFASGGSSILPGYLGHNQPLRKTTLALDDYVTASDSTPDLIKIDVEGAEARVLLGLSRTLSTIRPILFVELHGWENHTVSDMAARVLEQLDPLAYRMVYLRTRTVVSDPAVFSGRGRCHVLLSPSESSILNRLETLDTSGL